MARRSSRRTGAALLPANGTLPRPTVGPAVSYPDPALADLEDTRRSLVPFGRAPLTQGPSGVSTPLVRPPRGMRVLVPPSAPAKPTRSRMFPWRTIPVAAPASVRFCIQRKQRKEVLFAKGVAGKNKRRSPGRGGGYRRSAKSNYRC